MLEVGYSTIFKRDLKRMRKRGANLENLKNIVMHIQKEKELPPKYKNHKLIGNYSDRWECHIQPDWLLIYKLFKDKVRFERTGSHSDLFK